MPLTPFIGLSVAIHIGIILLYRLFNLAPATSEPVAQSSSRAMRWLGCGIITVVFGFVLTNAIILVRASVEDRHSVVHMLEHYLAAERHSSVAQASSMVAGVVDPDSVNVPIGSVRNSGDTCARLFDSYAEAYHGSVVDYLQAKSAPNSFSARRALASDFGIADYQGTSAQNIVLLRSLFVRFNEFSSQGCSVVARTQ